MSWLFFSAGTRNARLASCTSAIANIYAQIPGSQTRTGQLEGYTLIDNASLQHDSDGNTWSMISADFTHSQASAMECIKAFFIISIGQGGPSWVISDTFLYSPAYVSFAALSETAIAQNGVEAAVPSPTNAMWCRVRFECNHFTVTALGVRKVPLDHVNTYASFWRAVKTT
ncbi:uncharacterized protein HD556DRAFT_1305638 [Suillus plorans]|uniref:Uncharacterized protein n=1 Tax=Suillus plorans TaxID=116603 RepID=A0A9P7DNV6_9AGAM|nr:uncharacterized protein HD556DRAFT_1305638 [Suillus plorans]KAG1799424.1 hypothetical protein HD556DRAFT_1305638 [Suillus plorans]